MRGVLTKTQTNKQDKQVTGIFQNCAGWFIYTDEIFF